MITCVAAFKKGHKICGSHEFLLAMKNKSPHKSAASCSYCYPIYYHQCPIYVSDTLTSKVCVRELEGKNRGCDREGVKL